MTSFPKLALLFYQDAAEEKINIILISGGFVK
jgi:hypothetical protein